MLMLLKHYDDFLNLEFNSLAIFVISLKIKIRINCKTQTSFTIYEKIWGLKFGLFLNILLMMRKKILAKNTASEFGFEK